MRKPPAPHVLDILSERPDTVDTDPDITGEERPPQIAEDCENKDLWDSYLKTQHDLFAIIESYELSEDSAIIIRTYYSPPPTSTSPILFCLHGAGSSAMTFAAVASEISDQPDVDSVGIFCFDLRGHGDSSATSDYSMRALISDVEQVLTIFCAKYDLSQNSIYFMGHSLGGAILSAVLASFDTKRVKPLLAGLILLDIVQETAIKSLVVMPAFIKKRPANFTSLNEAIDWHMGLLLFNRDSAALSIPHLLNREDLSWKTNLSQTQPFWGEWFSSLSEDFLAFKQSKLLILSTHEALDKDLIVGQMQGRYQLVAFNNQQSTGHFVQEDIPHHVSICVLDFIKRNSYPERFMRENLGIVPKWGGSINK